MKGITCPQCKRFHSMAGISARPPWCTGCGGDLKGAPFSDEYSDQVLPVIAARPSQTVEGSQRGIAWPCDPSPQKPGPAAALPASSPLPSSAAIQPSPPPARSPQTRPEASWPSEPDRTPQAPPGRKQYPLAQTIGLIGAILGGVLGSQILAPQWFPQRVGQFEPKQMLAAGAVGAAGALIGWCIGYLLDHMRD